PHFTHSLPTRRSSDLSLNCIESISNLPIPGNENTVSTTIEPPNKKPNCNPAIVITVTSDFFKACPNITAFSLNPLDLAVLTKSSCSFFTKDERVHLVIISITINFLKSFPHITLFSLIPIHLDLLTKSYCSVLTKDERVNLVIIPILSPPNEMEDKIYPLHVSIPHARKILKPSANNSII